MNAFDKIRRAVAARIPCTHANCARQKRTAAVTIVARRFAQHEK